MAALLRDRPPSPEEVARILDDCRAADGVEPTAHFGGGDPAATFGAEVDGTLAGVALLAPDVGVWDLAVATAPSLRCNGAATVVLDAAVQYVDGAGAGPVRIWVPGGSAAADSLAFRHDFVLSRRLLRLQVELPLAVAVPWPPDYDVDALTDSDVAGVVAVNNRAFAWHEEQGRWTEAGLRSRLAEPGLDRAGFLVAHERRGGAVAGFCWTKLHGGATPEGEIYVICTDPAHRGAGLGGALTAAGLAHLSASAPVGVLYVDEGNVAARRTYRRLGFRLTRVDTRFTRDPRFRSEPFGGLV